ncbi:MAG: NADPH-dependent F420 reductase [Gammaproteobacteria bacterium]|nr:NADPH-dependent F420 reductase [Gammaproteobacteria bacterium]MCP4090694.1 NADPH-dependent F420 reductase [Gammaproteobacteria bacterium]MCP4277121.1 NADPH-dependent F420 reductase [Gammaproteobacteria bacterium]MCP4832677.1 NADPH-dependent F420 reductase [Gammaproteobacteria bacterium]MCP4928069.1 NADPH-dependent F420 reductase [Gammaproteobacteria bacterium]
MQTISIIGGTGELGGGLALRWAKAGLPVIIGSRDAVRAQLAADSLNQASGNTLAKGMDNYAAAEAGDIIVLTVKFSHHKTTLEELKPALNGKIVIDTTVPLVPPKVARVQLPAEGSAAVIAQQLLGEDIQVISAFQNVSASSLHSNAEPECDVLVTGAKPDARQIVIELANAAGFKAWHAGPLENSAAAEALTSLLIFMNKKYGSDHTGIRMTGISSD